MRRSAEDAILALRTQITDWATGAAKPDLRILAYPPESEPDMLRRIRILAEDLAADGRAIDLVDAGELLLKAVSVRPGLRERLEEVDRRDPKAAYGDLSVIARNAIERLLRAPLAPAVVARVVVNTGALATLVSYSQITSDLFGTDSALGGATVLAFPGDADERSLNLLHLRVDTAYRAPRI